MSHTSHKHYHLEIIDSCIHLSFCWLYFCSLKEFLPKEYIKQRGAEKKVFQVCTYDGSLNSVSKVSELNACLMEPSGSQKLRGNDGD